MIWFVAKTISNVLTQQKNISTKMVKLFWGKTFQISPHLWWGTITQRLMMVFYKTRMKTKTLVTAHQTAVQKHHRMMSTAAMTVHALQNIYYKKLEQNKR